MAKHGFGYTPPPFASAYLSWRTGRALSFDDVLAPVTSLAQRDGFFQQLDTAAGIQELAQQAATGNPGYSKLTISLKKRYDASAAQCLPDQSTYADLSMMPSAAALKIKLDVILAKVKASVTVRRAMAGYPSCLASKGFSAPTRSDLFEQIRSAFINKDPKQFHPGTSSWVAAARLEDSAAAADVVCRRAGHDAAMVALAEPVAAFARSYEAGLRVVDADWAIRVQTARAALPTFNKLAKASSAARR